MSMSKQQEMFELIEAWRHSGQTQKAFTQDRGITLQRFAYWIRKKKQQEQSSGGFLAIEPSGENATTVEVIYPNGVRVAVPPGDLPLISRLIGLR